MQLLTFSFFLLSVQVLTSIKAQDLTDAQINIISSRLAEGAKLRCTKITFVLVATNSVDSKLGTGNSLTDNTGTKRDTLLCIFFPISSPTFNSVK